MKLRNRGVSSRDAAAPDSAEAALRQLKRELKKPSCAMDVGLMRRCTDILYPEHQQRDAPGKAEVQERVRLSGSQSGHSPAHFHGTRRFRRKAVLLVAAALLAVSLLSAAIASVSERWPHAFLWTDHSLTVEYNVYRAPVDTGTDMLIPPAEDAFADLLRKYQLNHHFPAVPNGWELLDVVDYAEDQHSPGRCIGALYRNEAQPHRCFVYLIDLPSLHPGIASDHYDKDDVDPVFVSCGGYNFTIFKDCSYCNVFAEMQDCMLFISSPLSIEDTKQWIIEAYE